MCWSLSASLIATSLGAGMTVYEIKKKAPTARWFCIFYFTMMEAIQAVSYIYINQCALDSNTFLTYLSYIHISFQMPVITAFAFSFVSKKIKQKYFRTMMTLSFIASALMLIKMLVPAIYEVPATWLCQHIGSGLCGKDVCTYKGIWHLAWRLKLLAFDQHNLLYAIPVFAFPFFYGSWRFGLYMVLTGPLIANLLTSDKNEAPAIWCLYSIALLAIALYTPFRNIIFNKK